MKIIWEGGRIMVRRYKFDDHWFFQSFVLPVLPLQVELRRIETAEDVASLMAQSRNVVYLPSGQQTLLSLPQ
jgi:hypothetical protein